MHDALLQRALPLVPIANHLQMTAALPDWMSCTQRTCAHKRLSQREGESISWQQKRTRIAYRTKEEHSLSHLVVLSEHKVRDVISLFVYKPIVVI